MFKQDHPKLSKAMMASCLALMSASICHASPVPTGNLLEDGAKDVEVPTLALHGSEDTLIQPSGGRRAAEIMPNARYVEIEGLGHDLPAAYWPRVADEVKTLVESASAD